RRGLGARAERQRADAELARRAPARGVPRDPPGADADLGQRLPRRGALRDHAADAVRPDGEVRDPRRRPSRGRALSATAPLGFLGGAAAPTPPNTKPSALLFELLRIQLVPAEQLVEIRAVALREVRRLAYVAERVM